MYDDEDWGRGWDAECSTTLRDRYPVRPLVFQNRPEPEKKSRHGNIGATTEALLYNTAATATVDCGVVAASRGKVDGEREGGAERGGEVASIKIWEGEGYSAYDISQRPEWMSQIPLNTGQTSKSNWCRHAVMARLWSIRLPKISPFLLQSDDENARTAAHRLQEDGKRGNFDSEITLILIILLER